MSYTAAPPFQQMLRRVARLIAAVFMTAPLLVGIRTISADALVLQPLTPVADAHTNSSSPNKNYGRATALHVRQGSSSSPTTYHTLVRFDLPSTGIVGGTLRLYVTDGSSAGGVVHVTDGPWSESAVTWQSRPKAGAHVATIGPVAKGSWIEVPIDAAVLRTATLDLLIVSTTTDRASYASRESSTQPQLELATNDVISMPTPTPSLNPPTSTAAQPSLPMPTPDPTLPPTPGSAPTVEPTPVAEPNPTLTPTLEPAPTLTSTPTEGIVVVGYGSSTTGGTGGRVIEVRTVSELTSALQANGPRIVQLIGSGEWAAHGAKLAITEPFVTVDGSRCSCYLRDGWIAIRASEVILRDLRIRTGDETVDAKDADPISINGGTAGIHNIVVDHVEAIWGPDVGGITILNKVSDVTVQHSIIGEGLFRSRHPEAHEDADGHSYAMNISGVSTGGAVPQRITVYRNLLTTSESRNPRICGAVAVDLVNNVIYNHRAGPGCNPQSLNMVANLLVAGPAPAAAALGFTGAEFSHTTSADFPTAFADAIYLADNLADGYILNGFLGPHGIVRSEPAVSLSVAPEAVAGLLDRVAAEVGPSVRDDETLRLLNNLIQRSGLYVSGNGVYPPR